MPNAVALTIGNFDGVHLGHVELVRTARRALQSPNRHPRDRAKSPDRVRGITKSPDSYRVIVLAFDPHPLSVLRPQFTPARLSTFEQRTAWLRQAGADEVIRLEPIPALLNQTPQEFIAWVASKYRPDFIVEGPDFGFGKGRTGSIETLRELENVHRYRTIVIDPVETALTDQTIVLANSTLIRWLLQRGRVTDAARLLGRPFELCGQVVVGDRRGRELGVPTINIDYGDFLLPADGVYAGVAVRPDGTRFPAAISIGSKPTFGRHARVCEAHLIGYNGPLNDYGWTARLQLHRWLRDQLHFSDMNLLIEQMRRDMRQVEQSQMIQTPKNKKAFAKHLAIQLFIFGVLAFWRFDVLS